MAKQNNEKTNDKMLARIEKLYDDFDTEKGSMMILYVDPQQRVHTYNCGSMLDCAAMVATAVDDAFDPSTKDEGERFAGRAILEGLCAVIERGGISSLRVALRSLKALRKAITKQGKKHDENFAESFLESLTDIASLVADDDKKGKGDDDREREDCEHCKANKICPLPDAIAYRKANHLPNPNRKHGKKGNNAN